MALCLFSVEEIMNDFSLEEYNYNLPEELIASQPLEKRDHSRLLLVDRKTGTFSEIPFYEIKNLLLPNDQLILNDTRVIRARLHGKKESGGAVEIFLLRHLTGTKWEVLAKPARKIHTDTTIHFGLSLRAVVLEKLVSGNIVVEFQGEGDIKKLLHDHGEMPLPHYMQRKATEEDEKRYQTVFAKNEGAVAAPTAALHFTDTLLEEIKNRGVECVTVTLHVGLGTFKPVQTEDIRDHQMHEEFYSISEEAASLLKKPKRKIVVGTTTLRTLEASSIQAGSGSTDIYIYPGYRFKTNCALLTNFHLPKSSLYILVSAFAGKELIREAYAKAIKDRFRFYSYGDAMLII